MSSCLRVLEPGPLMLVQDAGRPGLASLGVGAAGAFDRGAHRLGNRLVGNPADAAGLEILLGGAVLEALADTWIALTGAWGAVAADGRRVEPHTATLLRAGSRLEIGPAERGVRYYLAVRGGIDVPPCWARAPGTRWQHWVRRRPAQATSSTSAPDRSLRCRRPTSCRWTRPPTGRCDSTWLPGRGRTGSPKRP
ncbi:hypothetical protein GCM10025866_08310 [Naasia aerilata]|uniref:Carboxyltransferase domain-containing protein n=1 Tax=Naasia aerilata TaxID=1162966 RepID=A0ABN6XJ72_9MICO|nr:hypothetical protein GCM10025866_08310 [Naasia aerilata]